MRCWYGYLFAARCRLFAYGPADATAIPKPHHMLSHFNRLLLSFWYRLTQVVLGKRPLNGCSVVVSFDVGHCTFILLYITTSNRFITARCYAYAVLTVGLCLSVCVCPSVTSRCSTKTAKRRITQTTPHDTPGTLVF